MIRDLKALGLALCAVLAFGGLSASAASAANDVLTSDASQSDTFVTGTQIGGIGAGNVFGTKSKPGVIECATGSYKGQYATATATEVEVTPSYTGCKIGAGNATVTPNGCKFVLTGTTDLYTNTSGVQSGEDATVRLNCNDTAPGLVVTGPLGCVITFSDTHPASTPVNQNLLGVKYDNEETGGKKDVKATVTVDKITYTSNGNCQSLGFTATDSDGFLTTNVTLKGYSDAAHTSQANLSTSAASETTDLFTSDASQSDTFVTGTQIGGIGAGNVFGTKSKPGVIECATGSYKGQYVGATATQIEVTPSYTGCKIGAGNATVTPNGCKFVLTGTTDAYTNTSGVASGEDATVKLNCNDTAPGLVVDGPLGCVITFSDTHPASTPVNQNLLGVKYDNEETGGKKDVKATVTVDKITYTSNGNCQSLGFTATDSDGFLTTNVTLKGYSDAAHTSQANLEWS